MGGRKGGWNAVRSSESIAGLKCPGGHRTFRAAMKFILTTHNVTLTDAIEQHLLAKLDRLEHIDRWLLDARVTLEKVHTAKTPEGQFKCGIRVGIRGNDLYAEDREADLYAAIDLAVKKLEGQVRKKHNKAKARKHNPAAKAKVAAKSAA